MGNIKLPDSLDKKFRKEKEGVYHARSENLIIDENDITSFFKFASDGTRKVYRLCLNKSKNEKLQEMIIFHPFPHIVPPHKQRNRQSVSYSVLYGELFIDQYSENGKIYSTTKLSPVSSQGKCFHRMPGCDIRAIKNTHSVIFREISDGPFSDSDTIWLDSRT